MSSTKDIRLLVKVARLHYEHHLSQQEIAEQLQVSISSISRMLKQARQQGIIEVRINDPSGRLTHLETRLKQSFGLKAAIVVPGATNPETTRTELGRAVAQHIEMFVRSGMVIGVSDGMTTAAVAASLRTLQPYNVQVVPLVGGVGMPDMYTHPIEVARTVARHLGGVTHQLNAPAMVQDSAIRDALMANPVIRSAFDLIARCDMAVVGVGAVTASAAMVTNGVMTPDEIDQVRQLGAVGAICARFYAADGTPIRSQLDGRTLSISLDQLRFIPHTIAVAIGADKAEAVHAALRGQIVNALGTDQATAELILT